MTLHKVKASISCITLVLVLLASVHASRAQQSHYTTRWNGHELRMTSGVIQVRFRDARSVESADAVLPPGFAVASPFLPPTTKSFPKSASAPRPAAPAREQLERTFYVSIDAQMHPMLAAQLLMTKYASVVEYAEPSYLNELHNTPNDPFVSEQLHLSIINALEAWDVGVGDPSVVMGICDDGMEQSHEDLAPNIAINTNEIPANDIDDDGNGYVDDYNGYNLAWRDDATPPGNTHNNRNGGHGTKVSGLAGATTDNGIGVAGVGRRCRIFPMKASSVVAGGVGYGYQGLIYAVARGFSVVNCSWGTVKPASPIDQSVIDYCLENNVVVVASSGNHGDAAQHAAWGQLNYPSAYPGVIGVGQTNAADHISGATGLGLNADVLAPAEDVLTTSADGGYSSSNVRGSSFAAPQVTGMVGLLRSKYPSLSVEQVGAVVRASAKDISQLNAGFPVALPGRIDVKKALTSDPFSLQSVAVKSVITQYPNGAAVERIGKGDTLALTFNLKNILAAVQGLECNLVVSGGSGWQMRVLNPDVVLGDIASGAERSTPPFYVVIDSIDNGQAILQLNLVAGSYVDHQLFYIPLPAPMATFENEQLMYSMGDNGMVAFDLSTTDRRGVGFNWKPSQFLMSPSGFLLCEGGNKGLGAFRNDTYISDFTAQKRFVAPERDRNEMSDADVEQSRRIGIQVSQRCTFPSIASQTTVWSVTLTNTSGADLHDVGAGYYLDVDLGPHGENNAIRIAPEAIPTTIKAEPSTAMVVSRDNLNAAVVMAAHSNVEDAKPQAAAGLFHVIIYDFDKFTDADRVLLLSSNDSIQTTTTGDVWGVIGMMFPGVLAPNESKSFTVVVGVGSSVQDAAQNVMNTLTEPQSVPQGMPAIRASIRPNPASEYMMIDHPDGASEIRIIDALGATLYTMQAEAGAFSTFATLSIPVGTYRCVITSNTGMVNLPLVILR